MSARDHDHDHDHDEEYLAGVLRSLEDDDFALEEPPGSVWAGILADLGDEAPRGPAEPPAPAPVTALTSRRRAGRGAARWLVAAAVVLVALVVGTTVIRRGGGPEGEVAAEATLTSAGLPNRNDLQGRAELVKVGNREEIDLDLPGLPNTDSAYYELWLMAPDGKRLQSLGITDGHGRYVVPTGIDPRQYPLVDVSREPPDGNPAHSGDSLVRGRLAI